MSSFIQSLQNDKQEIARKKFVQRSVMTEMSVNRSTFLPTKKLDDES